MSPGHGSDVLIIEDHDDTREFYVEALTASGFRCVALSDPEAAILRATTAHFAAVVMDLGMPRLVDGLGIAWRLRSLADAPPLVAVSGHQPEPSSAPLFREYLMKPVEPDALVAAVLRAIRS